MVDGGVTGAVGAAIPCIDGAAKVAGDSFGADAWAMGALLVKAVRLPHAHADFQIGAWSGFCARPGVAAIFTAVDIPGRYAFSVIPGFVAQPAGATSPARFRGKCVALVALSPGIDPDLVGFPVTWSPFPALTSPREAEAAAPLHPDRPGNLLIEGRVRKGDAVAAIATSAHVVTGETTNGFVEHDWIEIEAGAAWLDGTSLAIRACTQAPAMDREDTAAIPGLPVDRVRIIPSAVSGGFGSKLNLLVQALTGLVTLLTLRPGRMVCSRHESLTSTTRHHPAEMRGRIGCDAMGRISGMEFEGRFDTGVYSSRGPTVANRVPVHVCGLYLTPHITARARAIHTHGPVAGVFCGFGEPQAAL